MTAPDVPLKNIENLSEQARPPLRPVSGLGAVRLYLGQGVDLLRVSRPFATLKPVRCGSARACAQGS
ncbi:hypothetical protein OKW28_005937 [Paraburkholderia sp. 40]